MKKAIIYTRVSKETKYTQGISLEAQLEKCKKYCEIKDLEPIAFISDDGISGHKTDKRKGWVEMISYIENKNCDAVVCYSLSRFARNTVATISTIEQMNKAGIEFHSISDSIDTTTAFGKAMLGVSAVFNELERNLAGERTKNVLDLKRSKGEALGSIPYGLTNRSGLLAAHPTEIEVVEHVIGLRAEGTSFQWIAETLTEMGYKGRGGKLLRQNIQRIVRNHEKGVYDSFLKQTTP